MSQVILWIVLVFNPSTGEIKGGAQPLTFDSMEKCVETVREYIKTTPAPPGVIAKGYCLNPQTDQATIVEPGASRT